MQYNRSQKSEVRSHWQYYVLNLIKHVIAECQHPRFFLAHNYLFLSRLRLLSVTSKCLTKLVLALMPLLLLLYSVNTQALTALSATTAQFINGNPPYLTFDNGETKVTTSEGLLGITLSDGTLITPETNTSLTQSPIELPNMGETFADVHMLVPPSTDSIALTDLIGVPYNYWGDDDGDGQGANGISASGSLSVSIRSKWNQVIRRSDTLNYCEAPYELTLRSTDGDLTTQYGVPNKSSFKSSQVTYRINPKSDGSISTICLVRPGEYFLTGWNDAENVNVYDADKRGYRVQSNTPSSYDRNFPTTGYNKAFFNIYIGGGGYNITWPTVTKGGITASVERASDSGFMRVTLTGPEARGHSSLLPLSKPNLPQTFEVLGYDSSNRVVAKYGFVLKQWFISPSEWILNPGITIGQSVDAVCSNIGYRVPSVKDLTNVKDTDQIGFVSNTPKASSGRLMPYPGAGFFSEWGGGNTLAGELTVTSDSCTRRPIWGDLDNDCRYIVDSMNGFVANQLVNGPTLLCVYP